MFGILRLRASSKADPTKMCDSEASEGALPAFTRALDFVPVSGIAFTVYPGCRTIQLVSTILERFGAQAWSKTRPKNTNDLLCFFGARVPDFDSIDNDLVWVRCVRRTLRAVQRDKWASGDGSGNEA
jgi:hypothetical protein